MLTDFYKFQPYYNKIDQVDYSNLWTRLYGNLERKSEQRSTKI